MFENQYVVVFEKVHCFSDLASDPYHRGPSPSWPPLHELPYISHYQVELFSEIYFYFSLLGGNYFQEYICDIFGNVFAIFVEILRKTRKILSGRQSKQRQSESNLAVNIHSSPKILLWIFIQNLALNIHSSHKILLWIFIQNVALNIHLSPQISLWIFIQNIAVNIHSSSKIYEYCKYPFKSQNIALNIHSKYCVRYQFKSQKIALNIHSKSCSEYPFKTL